MLFKSVMPLILIVTFCLLNENINGFTKKAPNYLLGCKDTQADLCIASYVEEEERTLVNLNNEIVLKFHGKGLFEGDNGWKKGDKVFLEKSLSGKYFLHNMNLESYIPVRFFKFPKELPRAIQLNKNINLENIVINSEVVLNDFSKWHLGSWASGELEKWKINDRVFVTPSNFMFGKATHLIINVDSVNTSGKNSYSSVRVESKNKSKHIQKPLNDAHKEYKKYDFKIKKLDTNATAGATNITLSNGLNLQVPLSEKAWAVGDHLIGDFFINSPTIYNLTRNQILPINKINYAKWGKCVSGIKIVNNKNGTYLYLEDRSQWYLGHSKVKHWSMQDRILILQKKIVGAYVTTHDLINLDCLNKDGEFERMPRYYDEAWH